MYKKIGLFKIYFDTKIVFICFKNPFLECKLYSTITIHSRHFKITLVIFKEYVVNMGFFCRYPDTHLMNMFPDMDRVLTG
jgi:hypothetical protein